MAGFCAAQVSATSSPNKVLVVFAVWGQDVAWLGAVRCWHDDLLASCLRDSEATACLPAATQVHVARPYIVALAVGLYPLVFPGDSGSVHARTPLQVAEWTEGYCWSVSACPSCSTGPWSIDPPAKACAAWFQYNAWCSVPQCAAVSSCISNKALLWPQAAV